MAKSMDFGHLIKSKVHSGFLYLLHDFFGNTYFSFEPKNHYSKMSIFALTINNNSSLYLSPVLGESLMAVKKDYKISQVVMVITRKILNLLQVAGAS